MSQYHRQHPEEPHPFAREVEYVSDAWREEQAEQDDVETEQGEDDE